MDGYNIIFAWDDLRELSETDLAAARGKLADILCDYQGYRKCTLILVFDAYKVEGNPGKWRGITISTLSIRERRRRRISILKRL